MWTWDQSAGELRRGDGAVVAKGYSGADWGKNNPDAENVKGVGPIPKGLWAISEPRTSPNTGPVTMNLDPLPGTDALGRSAFRIHGDSIKLPGKASHGCIILPRNIRLAIWQSGDHTIEVVE